jgi:hypothetical protein
LKQNVSPVTALLIVLGCLAVLGGIFFWQSRRADTEAKETAQRGEERGRMMMQGMQGQGMQGRMTNEEMMQRMRGGTR